MTHLDELVIVLGVVYVVLVADVPSVELDIVGILWFGAREAKYSNAR